MCEFTPCCCMISLRSPQGNCPPSCSHPGHTYLSPKTKRLKSPPTQRRTRLGNHVLTKHVCFQKRTSSEASWASATAAAVVIWANGANGRPWSEQKAVVLFAWWENGYTIIPCIVQVHARRCTWAVVLIRCFLVSRICCRLRPWASERSSPSPA